MDFIDLGWLTYAPYHIPNLVLGAVMWTLFGRFLLQPFVRDPNGNYILKAFVWITAPAYAVFRIITPPFLAAFLYPLYYAFLIMIVRILFFILMRSLGLTPPVDEPSLP